MTITATTTPDPYAVLGVSRDATTAEIRSAYKKLVLKCHPDKILDEAKRSQGQDEFQKVQQAWELLSDEAKRAKYDLKAQLAAEARRSAPTDKGSSSSPSSSSYFKTTYEYRGGKFYEEKTFVGRPHEEPPVFTEEPRASSRKYDGYERKHTAKEPEEKKKSKSFESSSKSTKEKLRESQRSSRKTKDKERKREQSEKHSTRNAYAVTDDEASQPERDFTKSPRHKSSHERKEDSSKYNSPKYVVIEDNAFEYIQRSKAGMSPEPERRGSYPMASPPPVYYDSLESMVGDTARRSSARPLRRSGPDLRATYEVVDSPLRGRPAPRKTTSSSSGIRVATGSRPPTRSSTTYEVKGSKGIPTLRRAETAPHPGHPPHQEPLLPRSSRGREQRYDSGYSSPGTPDFHGSPPKSSSKFTIIDEDEDFSRGHRTVIVEPYRRHQSVSPSRRVTPLSSLRATSRPAPQARGRPVPNMRTESARVIPSRNSPPLRHGSGGLFAEVDAEEYVPKFTPETIRFSPRIRQEDVRFTEGRPSAIRKESYARAY
jgi:curved DNA-binding protein CbpA